MAVEPYFSYLFPTLEGNKFYYFFTEIPHISFRKGEKHNEMMREKCTENI